MTGSPRHGPEELLGGHSAHVLESRGTRGIPDHNYFRLRQKARLLGSDTARKRRQTRWIIADVGVTRRRRRRRIRKGLVGLAPRRTCDKEKNI